MSFMKMNKSIALIGGGGFIGTNLTNYFLSEGFHVLVIGRNMTKKNNSATPKLKNLLIDTNDTHRLKEALVGYENIVWLANSSIPSTSVNSLTEDFACNIAPLINLLELSSTLIQLKNFIFISSGGTIYGESSTRTLTTEKDERKPISSYGLSKKIAEDYIDFITKNASFNRYILRPSNVYGDHQNLGKPQGIVGYAFDAALNKKPLTIFNNGEIVRDFIHVLDLAAAVKDSINSNNQKQNIFTYNVGSQTGHSIKEILHLITRISNKTLDINPQPARSFDCNYNVLSIEKIKTELGWTPKISLEDGLKSVWKWIESNEK